MSDPEFKGVQVIERRDRGSSGVGLKLDIQAVGLEGSFERAGQYLRARASGSETVAYLAVASAPSDGGPWELLLQPGGKAVDEILASLSETEPPGELEISGAEGKGFGLEAQAGRDLLLLAGGSGISALRSVLREALARRDRFGKLALRHGVRTPAALGYPEEHDAWKEAGVELQVVVSREDPEWNGARGHLQDHLVAAEVSPARSSAFLCGPKAMQEALTDHLLELGFDADRILTNF